MKVFFLVFNLCMSTDAYKHVVLLHGFMADAGSLHKLASVIVQEHPGTNVTVLDSYRNLLSTNPLWCQVSGMRKKIKEICENNTDGIHIIGYSQGGIIARGIIETLGDHNVDTFISLSSPQMGIYGGPIPKSLSGLNEFMRRTLYKIFYSKFGQLVSVSEYWKDPYHLNMYRKCSVFLPVLNNEIDHKRNKEFKENFLRLKKLVLMGGPDDGTIVPWDSSQFGFFKENSRIIAEMKEQEIYKNDYFGLKSLDERGGVHSVTVPNVSHDDWIFNEDIIKRHIVPWLT